MQAETSICCYFRHVEVCKISVRASRRNRPLGGPWHSRAIVAGQADSLRAPQMAITAFSPRISSVINNLNISSKTGLIFPVQEVPLGPVTP